MAQHIHDKHAIARNSTTYFNIHVYTRINIIALKKQKQINKNIYILIKT